MEKKEVESNYRKRIYKALTNKLTGEEETDDAAIAKTLEKWVKHQLKLGTKKSEVLRTTLNFNDLFPQNNSLRYERSKSGIEELVNTHFAEFDLNVDRESVGLVGKGFQPGVLTELLTQEYNILATPKTNSGKGGNICYLYRNGTYLPEGADFVVEEANRLLYHVQGNTPSRLASVLALTKIVQAIDQEDMNHKAMDFINVRNGMLDWKTGDLLPHDPSYRCTFQVNSIYDPAAKSEMLDDFFTSVFNPDAIDLVEELVGYLLLPTSQLQKCFIAIGPGGNGKSTFLGILEHFLGKGSISFETLHDLAGNVFSRANLLDKICNISHEVGNAVVESTGILKSLSSGDTISAQMKHQDPFIFTPFARLLFATNEFPYTRDQTEAFYQRLVFIEFPKCFRGSGEEIPDFAKKACEDPVFSSALLNRALMGLCRVMERGEFSPCESSERRKREYKAGNEGSCSIFIREHFDYDSSSFVPISEMFEPYKSFTESNGMHPLGRNKFYAEVATFPSLTRGRENSPKRAECFWGIKWKPESTPFGVDSQVAEYAKKI